MVVGIAGGVGSGKSTVLGILKKEYGAYICMADELGHEAMRKGETPYYEIVRVFGGGVCRPDGEIDRELLARRVYCDSDELGKLNAIVHPYVKDRIRKKIASHQGESLFVLETAILFETGCDTWCDEVWGVVTDDEIRIRRLMDSRNYSRGKAERIMANQSGNAGLAERCDRILRNNGDFTELAAQIGNCMENLLENKG